ncbi:MAG TPA: enoyl-CoA hydratase-related protein [Actinomycetota bacterium]|nr:enoyl-CoA hydratase-related protein [Actinomycetota bacterium]
MDYATITHDVSDGVATITLNRPDALNALDNQMAGELQDALKKTSRDKSARALVLTGAGRAFCSGQDLKAVTGESAPATLGAHVRKAWNPIVLAIHEMDKPVVAAVNGVAAGAGCSLALVCDVRIASEKAMFIEVFSKVGLIPDSGSTWLLPRLVGFGKALEMAWTAEPVGAQDALALGLVNRVVAPDDLETEAHDFARGLASGPTLALTLTKRAMVKAMTSTFAEALHYEAHLQTAAGRSSDYAEGVAAFLEKRPASFKGS